MTTRIAILPYGPSDSCTALRNALQQSFLDNSAVNIRKLRSDDSSAFRGRAGDIIINYGNRSAPAERFGAAHVLNPQSALNNAANKLNALNTMQQAGVSVIPFTTDPTVARGWAAGGQVVYRRAILNGHSGEGITVLTSDNLSEIGNAPLYTRGIGGQRREWRVHVFDGVITHVQVKRRRNGYQTDPNYREDIRNHHTGWIYATENINPSQAVLRNAVRAVQAMGLTFGAVDVISHRDSAWVLEVNTAPGLQAETTMTAFVNAINVYVRNRLYNAGLSYQSVYEVQEEEESEAPRDDEGSETTPEPATINPATFSRPQPQTNENGQVVGRPIANLEDGYYLADFTLASTENARNIIVWVSNGIVFRHGWNLGLERSVVSNFRKINSLNIDNSTAPITVPNFN